MLGTSTDFEKEKQKLKESGFFRHLVIPVECYVSYSWFDLEATTGQLALAMNVTA